MGGSNCFVILQRGAGISANLTNFFNSLGEIGREEYSRNMIMSNPALYYSIDSKGNISLYDGKYNKKYLDGDINYINKNSVRFYDYYHSH